MTPSIRPQINNPGSAFRTRRAAAAMAQSPAQASRADAVTVMLMTFLGALSFWIAVSLTIAFCSRCALPNVSLLGIERAQAAPPVDVRAVDFTYQPLEMR